MKEFSAVKTAVVANGEVPGSELSSELLHKMERIVCCDGALQKLLSINVLPTVIVGDGDSLDCQLLNRLRIPYHADESEEYNDLQKALKYCLSNGYDDLLLLGCGGLREDHFIANLSIMTMYSEQLRLTMLTEYGVFTVIHGTTELASLPGMQVSVFTRDPRSRLTFSGLKYPVNGRQFSWLWEGSLNEAVGTSFRVEMDGNAATVVYRTL